LKTLTNNGFVKVNELIEILRLDGRDFKMQKTKVIRLISKFIITNNPFRAIIPFLLAVIFFSVTITPLQVQVTQENTPSVYEKPTNLTTKETATASSIKPEIPQPTVLFCPNCGNLSQWYQTTKK
jgi:hypothetical protein